MKVILLISSISAPNISIIVSLVANKMHYLRIANNHEVVGGILSKYSSTLFNAENIFLPLHVCSSFGSLFFPNQQNNSLLELSTQQAMDDCRAKKWNREFTPRPIILIGSNMEYFIWWWRETILFEMRHKGLLFDVFCVI